MQLIEAVGWFLRSIEANRNYPLAHFWLANALALLGSLNQAGAAANAGLALDPSFTICRFRDGGPSNNPTFLAKRERNWGLAVGRGARGVKASALQLPIDPMIIKSSHRCCNLTSLTHFCQT